MHTFDETPCCHYDGDGMEVRECYICGNAYCGHCGAGPKCSNCYKDYQDRPDPDGFSRIIGYVKRY